MCGKWGTKTRDPSRVQSVNFTEATEQQFRITVRADDNESFGTARGEEHFSTGLTFLSLILVNLNTLLYKEG